MAPAIPLVAAAAGYAASAAIGYGIVGAVAGFVVSSAINQIGGKLFSKKPKAPAFSTESQGRTTVVRSAIESHKIIYGEAKVSGPLVFVATTDKGTDNLGGAIDGVNKLLHMVLPLAGHEVEEIGTVYFNDQALTLDGDGWVTSEPYGKTTTTNSTVHVTAQVQGAARTSNVATYTTNTPHGFLTGETVKVSGATNNKFNGSFIITATPTTTTFQVGQSGANDTLSSTSATARVDRTSSTSSTKSYARVRKFLGSPDQAADPVMVANIPGWTADHRLRGIAGVYVCLEYNADVYPLGIPNVSAIVKGKKVYDPRTEVTEWSENAALCVRDYLGADYGFSCQADEINEDYAIAAANICDEDIPLADGVSTQKRYTCNGVVDTATAPLDNLESLLTSLAGAVTYVQGMFRVYAGAYYSPDAAFEEYSLAGPVKLRTRTTRKELFNAVRGTYVDPQKNWQPTDFPPVTSAAYEAEDGGEQIFKDLELPFTNHPAAARRIAMILREKARQMIVEMSVNHAGINAAVYDTVGVGNAQFGWSNKKFRILKFSTTGTGPLNLVLQAESPAIYDWDGDEGPISDPVPDTNLPNPFNVQPPGALTVTESKYVTRDGDGVKARATLTWGESPDAFARGYQVEYKLLESEAWTVTPRIESTTQDIEDIAPGEYDFRVKTFNNLGVSSPYSTAVRQINGLLDPPDSPQNLTISTIGGLAILRWDPFEGQTNLDVKIGGRVVIRHSPDEADGWTQSTSIGNALPGSSVVAVLPLKPGIYLVKAVDSSGIESVTAATVTTSQATALAFANVTSITEHPTFSGSKTDCFVSGGALWLGSSGIFDDIDDFDSISNLDAYGGISPTGTYLFSGGIDLGSVTPVRLTSHLKGAVVNVLDMIDERAGDIDDWVDFDGALAASADASVYVRATNDDPSGSPTWGAWHRLDSGEFSARAFQFKAELTSQDPAYSIAISELSVTAAEVA